MGCQQPRWLAGAFLVFSVMVLTAACSSTATSTDSWSGSYFKDPDSVWNAVMLSLIELDFEVTEKNRPDGVIRAQSSPAEDGTVIVFDISQVAYTEDQVNLFVRPSFGDSSSGSRDLLKAAADGFMASIAAKLNP